MASTRYGALPGGQGPTRRTIGNAGAPTELDKLERSKFGDFWMPYTTYRVVGTLRHNVHVYRRVPGGRIEKQARALYEFTFNALFHTTLKTDPPLWPDCINGLRRLFERGETASLVVPSIGTLRATIIEWDQQKEAVIRSGEAVTIKLLEDIQDELGPSITVQSAAAVRTSLDDFELLVRPLPNRPTLFDEIMRVSNELLAYRDQFELHQQLLANQIDSLRGLFEEADATLDLLDDPENNIILQAFFDLWDAVISLGKNPTSSPVEPRVFVTDKTMTVSEVSSRIYDGDTSYSRDLMALNYFEDPLAIPAATSVVYIPQQ